MSCHEVTSAQFQSCISAHEVVFVDFWAAWCAPCKQFLRVYEQIEEQYPSIFFAKVNIEEEQELADLFEIRSIPHLMIFKKGIIIYSDAGTIPESALKELAQQALAADVDAIVAELHNPQD